MKIAVLIPSRNRPRMLRSAITVLNEMASGENEVEYRIGYDADDIGTASSIPDKIGAIGYEMPPEILTIGAIWNELAKKSEADVYSCMIDDAFCITPHWDKEMIRVAGLYSAFSWFEVSAPENVGYPTCTKSWIKLCGYIVPEHFPFWFCDTWFAELVQFVTGNGVPISQSMTVFSKQEETQNLRELDFWWGFFNATRSIRLKKAHTMLTTPVPFDEFMKSRARFIESGEARDREFQGERIKQLEGIRSSGQPSARYILAKQKAEQFLADNGLILWGCKNC